MNQALPPLPPRLHSAALAAAEHLTAIAHSEGIELGGLRSEALPHLITLLYTIRERCVEAEREPQPWLGDRAITPGEIAGVLETIAQLMISDGTHNLAGHNPSWFTDAARIVEHLSHDN
jgi:hypothetical protein